MKKLLFLILSIIAYTTSMELKSAEQSDKNKQKICTAKQKEPSTKNKRLTFEFLDTIKRYNPQVELSSMFHILAKYNLHTHLLRADTQFLEAKINGKTALFTVVEEACKAASYDNNIKGKVSIIRNLLHIGADVNTCDDNTRQTPLHVAVEHQNEKIIRLLCMHGANKKLEDIDSKTPIDLAKENKIIYDLLLANFKKAKKIKFNSCDLYARIAHEILMTLPYGKEIDTYKQAPKSAPIFIAIECGMLHHLIAFLGNKNNRSLINTQLKNQPYNKKLMGMSPLYLAIELACKHAKKGNQKKYTTYTEIIKLLLAYDADIHAQTYLGYTPLHIAAENNNPELVKLLLSYGANTLTENHKQKTAYNLSRSPAVKTILLTHKTTKQKSLYDMQFKKRKLAQEFLQNIPKKYELKKYQGQNNAEVHIAAIAGIKEHLKRAMHEGNISDIEREILGETPLIACANAYIMAKKRQLNNIVRRRLRMIGFLLAKGANIHATDKNKNGNTILHIALQNNDIQLARILYPYKPDVLQKNKKGLSPLKLSEQLEDDRIYRDLKALLVKKEKSKKTIPTTKTISKDIQASSNNVKEYTAVSKQNMYPEIIPLDAAQHFKTQESNPFYEQPTMNNLLPDIHELDTLPSAPLLGKNKNKKIRTQKLIALED